MAHHTNRIIRTTMPYLREFLIVAIAHLLAVMSPGPDFAMISRNSLVYSRRTGVLASVGLAMGILVHVTYCLVGIGLIISKSIILFSTIKWLGAGYLIYIGYKSLRSKPRVDKTTAEMRQDLTRQQAVWTGFLTNVLNPKATLFFLALFTQVISPKTPLLVQVLYGLEMSVMTFAWFALVAVVLSHSLVKSQFARVQHYLEKVFGAVLIALGIRVALTQSK